MGLAQRVSAAILPHRNAVSGLGNIKRADRTLVKGKAKSGAEGFVRENVGLGGGREKPKVCPKGGRPGGRPGGLMRPLKIDKIDRDLGVV